MPPRRILQQDLPIEIIELEVLPRLPAKFVGRIRCVCKSWNSLLCTPTFARLHLRYQTRYKYLYLDYPPTIGTFNTLDCEVPMNHGSLTLNNPAPFEEQVYILACLDGLVCVALTESRDLAFWNPVTGAYKKLAQTRFYNDLFEDLQYTPLAFYYVDSCKDYKLLHIVYYEGAFVYSWRLDSWRKLLLINNNISIHHMISNFRWLLGTVSGGKVYFNLESRWIKGERRIISFDVESEEFKEIQFPPLPRLPWPCWSVNSVTLNGCNHLLVTYANMIGGSMCDMWRMVGDGNGWIKVSVFYRTIRVRLPHRMAQIRRNGNWLAISDEYQNIDLVDFFTDLFCTFPMPWPYEYEGAIYIETLVSPHP